MKTGIMIFDKTELYMYYGITSGREIENDRYTMYGKNLDYLKGYFQKKEFSETVTSPVNPMLCVCDLVYVFLINEKGMLYSIKILIDLRDI